MVGFPTSQVCMLDHILSDGGRACVVRLSDFDQTHLARYYSHYNGVDHTVRFENPKFSSSGVVTVENISQEPEKYPYICSPCNQHRDGRGTFRVNVWEDEEGRVHIVHIEETL